MYEELCKCQELFTKFGGHPMAAGLSLPEANVEIFREYYGRKYGENEVQQAFLGRTNGIRMSVVYYPEINRYQGNESIQIVIKNYQ